MNAAPIEVTGPCLKVTVALNGGQGQVVDVRRLDALSTPLCVETWPVCDPEVRASFVARMTQEHGKMLCDGLDQALLVAAGEVAKRLNGPAPGSEGEWPEPVPLPNTLPPVEPFDIGLLPASMRPWVADVADRMQCPPEYVAVTVMTVLGSLVARHCAIRPKANDPWTKTPNVWAVIVGRPGVLKSPALNEGMKPLYRLEHEAADEHEAAMCEYEARQQVASAQKKNRQQDLTRALKKGADPNAIAREIAAEMADDEKPPRTRYIVQDSTVERLTEILRDSPGGLLVYRDELLGLLYHLDREGQENERTFYLTSWNGGQSWESNRIMRGDTRVRDTTLSLVGGTQPGPLRAYLRGGRIPGQHDDGLLQRLQLAVWPDVGRDYKHVDRAEDREAKGRAYEVIRRLAELTDDRLRELGAEADPYAEPGERMFFRFDEEAQAEFDAWMVGLEKRVRSDDEHPAFSAHLSKYRSLIPSLALIVHMAEGQSGRVGHTSLLTALAWGQYLESHARRVYAGVTGADTTPAHALAAKIRSGALNDGFALRDVYRKHWADLTVPNVVREAAGLLVDLDWLREEITRTEGRTAMTYRINPRLLQRRAAAA